MSLGSMLLYFSHAIFTVQSQVGPQVRYTLAVPANQRPSPSPVIFVSQGHLLQPTLKALRQYNPPTSPLPAPNVSSYLPVTLYDGPSRKLLVLPVILTSIWTGPDKPFDESWWGFRQVPDLVDRRAFGWGPVDRRAFMVGDVAPRKVLHLGAPLGGF